MTPAQQPRRPALDARRDAVLRCLRVQLAAWRAGVWAPLAGEPANDTTTR